jgi:hypothetical protein
MRGVRVHWKSWAVAAAIGLLSACGGGGGSDPPPPPATGSIAGKVVASDGGQPIAGASVSAGSQSTQTAADGSFTLNNVATAARVVVNVRADGFGKSFGVAEVQANTTSQLSVRLSAAAPAQTFAANAAATLTVPQSPAQVQLPADSLVNAATGAAATGTLSARLTPIDPARDPQSMPGDYTTSAGSTIESFGALNVELADATGARLNLKPGSTATIRIPLATRSANAPSTIPLFFFNETTGRWVEEGSATLQGSAPNQYYEGTVTHFTFWNADQVAETIFVRGCLRNPDGTPATGAVVRTEGIDYSGSASARSDAQGNFTVPMRRGGRASVYSEQGNGSNVVAVGPSQTDITVSTCLNLSGTPLPPIITAPPQDQSVAAGSVAFFLVSARGSEPLSYRWQLNGADIPAATSYLYARLNVGAADAGVYTVIVSNAIGSAQASATLTVGAAPPPVIVTQPSPVNVVAGTGATFSVLATGATTYQWRRDGVDIAGATQASYTLAATAVGDSGAVFSVVVGNANGSVTSTGATLTVTAAAVAPSITTPPANAVAAVGASATFTVVAAGTAPLSYRWQRNGTDIAGANQASYTTPTLTLADNGAVFSVVVSNAAGSAASAGATLSVVSDTPGPTQTLLRNLLTLPFELFTSAFSPFDIADDNFVVLSNPSVCVGGGTYDASLNGTALASGTTLPTAAQALSVTYSGCTVEGGLRYNGTASAQYNGLSNAQVVNGTGTSTVTNFRVFAPATAGSPGLDVTTNGSVSVSIGETLIAGDLTSDIVVTPGNGASQRDDLNNRLTTFGSGSAQLRTVTVDATSRLKLSRQQFNTFVFTRGGVQYTASGFVELTFDATTSAFTGGSGEITLSTGNTQVGRIFATNQGLFIEVNGQTEPF